MTVLRKTTYVNNQVYNEYKPLFEVISEKLDIDVKLLRSKYMSNIENMLRIRGHHELANKLYD